MNRDQAKGHVKDIGGKLRQKVGKLTGNRSEQAKGAAKRVEGKVQKAAGDLKSVRRKDH
ncbi:MAG TPA: CsbD family protein [Burkholderiales bacterium]|nr:CsbD family protein [Burkholderiales bacterium]